MKVELFYRRAGSALRSEARQQLVELGLDFASSRCRVGIVFGRLGRIARCKFILAQNS